MTNFKFKQTLIDAIKRSWTILGRRFHLGLKSLPFGRLILNQHVLKDKIIDYPDAASIRLSCHFLETSLLCGNDNNMLRFCCENSRVAPRVSFNGDVQDAFNRLMDLRKELVQKLNRGEHCICTDCKQVHKMFVYDKPLISNIFYEARNLCNLKCYYCGFHKSFLEQRSYFVDVFNFVKAYNGEGNVKTYWFNLAAGEITILPERNEIYQAVAPHSVMFVTNALKYDEFIHAKLKDGSGQINVSIDCGSRELYAQIKGIDAYEKVCSNLRKYNEQR
jgi:sulfatase maturation enzyme AslB (radical SAM superfamily)